MEKLKILVLQGPPASGKSTWAKEFQNNNYSDYVIVSRDNERDARGKYWVPEQEDCISEIEYSNAEIWLKHGYSIISDSTNLNKEAIKKWEELAKKYNADIEFKLFFIPLEEAIARDNNPDRLHHVGKKVIAGFYKKYFYDDYKRAFTDHRIILEKDNKLPECIISDLDATYALHDGRHPFEWDLLKTDKDDWRLRHLYKMYYNNGVKIIFITGRPESVKKDTEEWINAHGGHTDFEYELYMKPNEDENNHIPSSVFKLQTYEKHIKDKYNVLCVYEDSERCVKTFRENGLLVLQPEVNR